MATYNQNFAPTRIDFPDPGALVARRKWITPGDQETRGKVAMEAYARAIGGIVVNEVRSTLTSLRDSKKPRTVAHALIYRDGQSVEELEARLGRDDPQIGNVLTALEAVGIVVHLDSEGVRRFHLVPPETSDGLANQAIAGAVRTEMADLSSSVVRRDKVGPRYEVGVYAPAEAFSRSVGGIVVNEVRSTLTSLRDSKKPRTVAHALIYRDGQSVEELEARLGRDDPQIGNVLTALQAVGIVEHNDSDGVPRFSIVRPQSDI